MKWVLSNAPKDVNLTMLIRLLYTALGLPMARLMPMGQYHNIAGVISNLQNGTWCQAMLMAIVDLANMPIHMVE